MVTFTIEVAGLRAGVAAHFDSTRRYCEKYLTEGTPEVEVAVSMADIAFEREKCRQENQRSGVPVQDFPDAYLETIALQRKITYALFPRRTLLFHGSVVAVDGAAYLFTAVSGTGKSTHTALWRRMLGEKAVMINDDKPFLRVENDRVLAFGTPWSGKHRLDTNTSAPLKAICILERGAENGITPIPAREALPMLFQQSTRPPENAQMPAYMDLIDGVARNVEFYRLRCNMDPDAAQVAYEGMK